MVYTSSSILSGGGAPRFRVGVDFHVYDGKFQGSRSHLLGVFGQMADLCPDIDFVFFADNIEGLRNEPGFDRPNNRFVRMPHCGALTRLFRTLPRLCKLNDVSLLHTQYVIPPFRLKGNAVTIHDVLFESHPQYFTRLFVLRSRLMMRFSARRADMVFAVSDFSRQEIGSRYAVPASEIGVLHNSVDRDRFYPGTDGEDVLAARGLHSGQYLLTVGRIEPRKNHAALLRAYRRVGPNPPPLVIVGQRDFGYGDFEHALAGLPPSHEVRVISDVGDKELPALYRHAQVFIYPSFAEGFGMPPLEAMASGVPVITSRSTAIPEVVGDAGLLVDPADELGLAESIGKLLYDQELRRRFSVAGFERSNLFSWRGTAERLAKSYRTYRAGDKNVACAT